MDVNEQFNVEPFDYELTKIDLDELDLDLDQNDAYLLHAFDSSISEIDESVISIPQRLKRAQRMRALSKRYAILRKMKSQRMAPAERLMQRARKAALTAIRLRIAGKAFNKFQDLPINQKLAIDQQIARRYGSKLHITIDRIARKFLPRIKKKEMERLNRARKVHEEKECYYDGTTLDDFDGSLENEKKQKGIFGVKDLMLTTIGAKKKIRLKRDIFEARKSAYDSEGGNEGDDHIINQLRKASMARGEYHSVTWKDGSASQVHPHHAKMALTTYAKMLSRSGPGYTGKEKQQFIKNLGKDENSFYDTIGIHEDLKYIPKLSGKKEKTKVSNFPKGLQDTGRPFLELPGKSAQLPYGVGPSVGHLNPSNTFGEEESPLELRRRLVRKRGGNPNFKPKAPKVIRRSVSGELRKVKSLSSNTLKPRSSGQRSVGNKITISARTLRRGNSIREENESRSVNKLGYYKNLHKLASEPRPNESREEWIIRKTKLEKKIKQLGGKIQEALFEKAIKYNFSPDIIFEVYFRGLEETLSEEIAFNRVNSFINNGFASEMDSDLMEAQKTIWIPSTTKRKGHYRIIHYNPKLDEEHGAGEIGTDELVAQYTKDTPGQEIVRDERYIAKLPWNEEEKVPEIKKILAGIREEFEYDKAHEILTSSGYKHIKTTTGKKNLPIHVYANKEKEIHLHMNKHMGREYVGHARFRHTGTSASTLKGFSTGIQSE